jgi:lysophospholipase L1-like esterase
VRGLGHHLTLGALAPLLPVMLAQGRRVRRTTPRLPDAGGEPHGTAGEGTQTLRIAVLGESTVSGVGARTFAKGLPGRLAAELAGATGARVAWRAVGENGATARRVTQLAAPSLAGESLDIAFLALGVNDVLEFTPVPRWRADVGALCDVLARDARARLVVLLGVPPMHRFPSLPQPLRAFLGTRARALDHALGELAARRERAVHVPTPARGDPELYCEDRFHPSEQGYAGWAAHAVGAIRPALAGHGIAAA